MFYSLAKLQRLYPEGFVIFALNSSLQPEEEAKILRMFLRMKKCDPERMLVAEGCYQGEIEQSYVVPANWLRVIVNMLKTFKQESVLYVDADLFAQLVHLRPQENQHLGEFVQCSANKAHRSEGYTKIGASYFTCEER